MDLDPTRRRTTLGKGISANPPHDSDKRTRPSPSVTPVLAPLRRWPWMSMCILAGYTFPFNLSKCAKLPHYRTEVDVGFNGNTTSTIDWTMSFRVTGGAMGVTATSAHCRHVCAPRHWMRCRGGCGCGLWSLGRILFWFLSRGFALVVRWWLYSSVNPKVFSKPIVKRINLGDETLHHASFWGVGTGRFVERWWRPGCGPSIHCCRLSKSPSDAN